MARPAPDRDPAARSRLIGTLSALVILWPLSQAAQVKPVGHGAIGRQRRRRAGQTAHNRAVG